MKTLFLVLALQAQPEPDSQLKKTGEADLKSQFKVEYSRRLPGDVRALAVRFLEGASGGEFREPGMRYAAFLEARNLFLRAGDVPAAFDTIDKLSAVFAVDGVAEKTAFLSKASAGATGDALSYVANLYFQAACEAALLERFDDAQKLFLAAESSASSCKDFSLRDAAAYQRGYFDPFKGAFQKSKKGDGELGRWLCFFKGDWAAGLSFLSAGSDSLSEVAKLELAAPASVEDAVRVADAWWESVQKEKSVHIRDSTRAHAVALFSKVSGAGATWVERFEERRRIIERDKVGDRAECVPGVKFRSRGVELMSEIGDGRCQIGYFNGRPSARTGVTETGPCVYFNVSDRWIQKGALLEISVDYFDIGGILSVGFPDVKGVKPPEGIQVGTTATWKTYIARVPAEAFTNGVHGADFRVVVTGKEGFIGRVAIRRVAK